MKTFVFTCLAMLVFGSPSAFGQVEKQPAPKIENHTRSIDVISVTSNGTQANVTFRNSSNKVMRACTLSVGNTSVVIQFYFPEQDGLLPGALFTQTVPLSSDSSTVVVAAAMLDGGTTEGDELALTDIRERRKGARIMLKKALREFQLAVEAQESTPDIGSLKHRIEELPETDVDGQELPPAELGGMSATRSAMVAELSSLSNSSDNFNPAALSERLSRLYRIHSRRLKLLESEEN